MVAHLLRMRWRLLANSFRRSTWQLVAVIIGAVYGLGVLAFAIIGLIALAFAPPEFAYTTIVLAGAAVILGWLIIPLIISGIDQTLDPARLATFPIPPRQLLIGLAVSGVLGVPGIVTLVGSLATVGTWIRSPLAAVAALVCAVIAVLTCVVGSRMTAALSASLSSGRRYRELVGSIVFIPLILLGPIITALGSGITDAADELPAVADAVAWSPLGAVWSVPGDVALGHPLLAGIRLLIALATLAVFAYVWKRALAVALVTPPRAASGSGKKKGLGLFGILPGTPTGAIAARALTYWRRDPRYARQLILVPLIPVLAFFYGSISGSGAAFLNASGPLIAFLLSVSIYADVSYDSTAFATHLSSGVSGQADRAGRVLALASFTMPIVGLVTVATVAFTSTWALLPGLLGIGFGVALCGFGVASVVSARVVFPVVAPGDNPFKAPAGAGVTASLTSFAAIGIATALALPELALGVASFFTGSAMLGWLALLVGLALGSVVAVVGIRIGGRVLDRRGPELLTALAKAN